MKGKSAKSGSRPTLWPTSRLGCEMCEAARLFLPGQVDCQGPWRPPSEAYCCAVLANVAGSHPGHELLEIRDATGLEQAAKLSLH